MKYRWHLHVDTSEKSWLSTHLARCGWPSVTQPSRPSISITISGGSGSGGSGSGGSGSGGSAGGPSTSGVKIVQIYFDSPGSDSGSNKSLNAEWVKIKNVTHSRKTITRWTCATPPPRLPIPGHQPCAGATLRVHTGRGANNPTTAIGRAGNYIWNNTGDTAACATARHPRRPLQVHQRLRPRRHLLTATAPVSAPQRRSDLSEHLGTRRGAAPGARQTGRAATSGVSLRLALDLRDMEWLRLTLSLHGR